MTNLNELTNLFTKEAYPPNDKNISEVPFKDIQNALFTHFGGTGFTQKVTLVGQAIGKEGLENYVCVELTLPLENGNSVTIPGAAQGKIGISGLITGAVRNAILRHAGMGAELYEHEEGAEPQFENKLPPGAPPSPFADPKPPATIFSNGQQYIPKKDGKYPPWTGKSVIKSGQWIGTPWNAVPDEAIAEMAAKGNNIALLELKRRGGYGQ